MLRTKRHFAAVSLALLAAAAACGGAPDPEPTGSTSSPVLRPYDLGPFDLIDDVKEIYGDYQWLQQLGSQGAPTQTDQILTDLAQLETQIGALSGQLQTLEGQIANLYAAQRQGQILATEQNVANLLAEATSAIEEANEWVQTGKTGPQIGSALDHSLHAMNTLSSAPFWYRPALTAGSPDIFDPRMALAAYLAALTARIGVLTIYDPGFRKVAEYRDEFASQVPWLQKIASLMSQNVTCSTGTGGPANSQNTYEVCSWCTDTVTGYQSIINGLTPMAHTPNCANDFFHGSYSDELSVVQWMSFYDEFDVLDVMGQHVVESFIPGVQLDATEPVVIVPIQLGGGGGPPPPSYGPSEWVNPGPLAIGNNCLTGAPNQWLLITACNGAADQKWTTPQWGGGSGTMWSSTALPRMTIRPAHGSCLDVSGWVADSGYGPDVYPEACSGSPGEQWKVTQDGHVVWAHDTRYCLALPPGNPVGYQPVLAPCADTPSQIWSRTFVEIIPIKL